MLHNCAKEILRLYNGVVPPEQASLESLPGIGPYTSAAILAFGYNLPALVIDTNIERFYELLLFGYNKPSAKQLHDVADHFIPRNQSREWHAALMDLMTEVRRQKSPKLQQKMLLDLLDVKPTWLLPELSDAPLSRPKQSKFSGSKRYFRGQIIAFLRKQPDHAATLSQLKRMTTDLQLPPDYSLLGLLEGLKKDRLIAFHEPLRGTTKIHLPR